MEAVMFNAPVPATLDLMLGGGLAVVASLLTTVPLVALVVREASTRVRRRVDLHHAWNSDPGRPPARHLAA